MKETLLKLFHTVIGAISRVLNSIYEIGAGMCILYTIEALVVLGLLALILGGFWKAISYPRKTIVLPDGRVKTVDDTDYHYKKTELWEPPTYWKEALKQAEKDWEKDPTKQTP